MMYNLQLPSSYGDVVQLVKEDFRFFCITHNLIFYIVVVLAFIIAILYNMSARLKSETIVLVRHVGLQVTVSYAQGYERSYFIPWSCIEDVVINEVVHFQRILYILVILTKDFKGKRKSIIPLFENTKPKLDKLEEIYRSIRPLLLNNNVESNNSSGDKQILDSQLVKFTINNSS